MGDHALFQMLMYGVNDAIYIHDGQGRIVEANQAASKQIGFSREQLRRMGIWDIDTAVRADEVENLLSSTARQEDSNVVFQATHRHASGQQIPVEVSLSRVTKGASPLFVAAVRDISQRRAIHPAVEQKITFNQLLLDISLRLVNLDPEQIDEAINDLLADIGQFFGVDRSYLIAIDWDSDTITNTHEWFAKGVPPSIERLQQVPFSLYPWLRQHMLERRVAHAPDVEQLPPEAASDKREFQAQHIQSLLIVPIMQGNEVGGMFGLDAVQGKQAWDQHFQDNLRLLGQLLSGAMEAARMGLELRHMAYHDPLTQLPNRKLLSDRIALTARRCQRDGRRAAVMLLDIDDFKLVNDTLTHAAGDELLCRIASRLADTIRDSDTIARIGGDEFALVCDINEIEDAADMADRIIQVISRPLTVQGQRLIVHSSIGITLIPEDETHSVNLLRNADLAMYQAKGAGKNRYAFFDSSMGEAVNHMLKMRSDLEDAVKGGQLRLHYQPRYALDSGRLNGMEALIRWQHPDKGLLSPREFLEIAERSDLICRIDQWAMDQACRQVRAFDPAPPEFRMAVNLSARDLYDHAHVDWLIETAIKAGIGDGRLLQLEITESMLMHDFHTAIAHLGAIKSRLPEVSIAIDDFGSGYSSLNYLRRLPVDSLKIDRAFIADLLEDDHNSQAIVRSIIGLARNLEMQVTAEGIETAVQLELLRAMGCEHGQGFLLGKPVPADRIDQIPELLTTRE